jgi:hypothetical protein
LPACHSCLKSHDVISGSFYCYVETIKPGVFTCVDVAVVLEMINLMLNILEHSLLSLQAKVDLKELQTQQIYTRRSPISRQPRGDTSQHLMYHPTAAQISQ